MGPAADRWRAAAEDPSRLWLRIERLKFVLKRRAERIEAERERVQKELAASVEYHANFRAKIDKALGQPRGDGDILSAILAEIEKIKDNLQHVTNEFANSLRREQDAWAENNKLKAIIAARDSKPVDNAEAIRERLLQPFLGSEADKLGANAYQLRDGEEWEFGHGKTWSLVLGIPGWYGWYTYRLAKGE